MYVHVHVLTGLGLNKDGLAPNVLVGVNMVSLHGGWNTADGPISVSKLTPCWDRINFCNLLSTVLVSSLFLRSAPWGMYGM